MHVLVIEDDPNIADMMLMVLEIEGFSVDVAADGERGLELARHSRPDVILLDVMLPAANGWAVAGAIRQDPDLASTPIVFCTSKSDPESTWRGWKLGAASYVTKPFDNEELVSELVRASNSTAVPGLPAAPVG